MTDKHESLKAKCEALHKDKDLTVTQESTETLKKEIAALKREARENEAKLENKRCLELENV